MLPRLTTVTFHRHIILFFFFFNKCEEKYNHSNHLPAFLRSDNLPPVQRYTLNRDGSNKNKLCEITAHTLTTNDDYFHNMTHVWSHPLCKSVKTSIRHGFLPASVDS